jgi:hypothetical protein
MQIKVVSVEVTNRGKYDQAEVTFKNLSFGEKVEAKKLMSFVNKDVYATVKNASAGDVFTIGRVKDDKGYWQWTSIAEGDNVPASTGGSVSTPTKAAASPSPKSTYETPEERAKRQVLIVRQSSLSSAIELLKTDKKSPTVPEVLQVAKQFENYVFGNDDPFGLDEKPANKLPELDEDDIPM